MSGGSDEVKRWTACRKAAVVLDIIKGKTASPCALGSTPTTPNGLTRPSTSKPQTNTTKNSAKQPE